ncbi:MAG: hypothetical protein F2536_00565 [Actinobacteria bacterium]|uniref:Unannotated protein n=1 Tax=freshwater metagenome TaxID=449393 RepID=A0A6J6DRN8_9ZZZZ|nr:hypothetical protein [Actinomycetota bacterium]MTA89406.1 hypothetical protein [Actinomycetota bacterium]
MNRWTFLVILFIGASWTTLLFPWVVVEAESLTGAELSELIALLPALAVLMLLISLYGKARRFLLAAASMTLALVVALSLSTNFAISPASVLLQESISGIAGESSLATQNGFYLAFAALNAIASISVLALFFMKPQKRDPRAKIKHTDSRSLWEEQA